MRRWPLSYCVRLALSSAVMMKDMIAGYNKLWLRFPSFATYRWPGWWCWWREVRHSRRRRTLIPIHSQRVRRPFHSLCLFVNFRSSSHTNVWMWNKYLLIKPLLLADQNETVVCLGRSVAVVFASCLNNCLRLGFCDENLSHWFVVAWILSEGDWAV